MTMRTFFFGFTIIVAVSLTTAPASLQEVIASPYDVVEKWMAPFADDGYAWSSHSGVAVIPEARQFRPRLGCGSLGFPGLPPHETTIRRFENRR